MKRLFTAAFFLTALAKQTHAGVDLRPRAEPFREGYLPAFYFADGVEKYGVGLDNETDPPQADGDGAIFRFAKLTQASMKLHPCDPPVPLPASGASSSALKVAEKLLPPAAEDVTLCNQMPEPLPINGWKSHRFVFTYTIGAVRFNESITFLNFPDGQQIVMQTCAQAHDFNATAQRADGILRRWHQILPANDHITP